MSLLDNKKNKESILRERDVVNDENQMIHRTDGMIRGRVAETILK